MRFTKDFCHSKHSAVYEYQKLKDSLNLTEEEEKKFLFLSEKVYDHKSEANR